MNNTEFLQVILLSIACLIVIFFNRHDFYRNTKIKNYTYFTLWIFLTIFCTWFSWGHDYHAYEELLTRQVHVEQIYSDLFFSLGNNYILWRFVVWGASSFFVILTFRNLQTTFGLASILFIMLPLMQFYCVTRNSLSLSVLFYALSLLKFRSVKSWILLILLVLLAGNLHQSMPLYLILFLLVCVIPFNKITIIISLILFPFIKEGIIMFSETFISLWGIDSFEETGFAYIDAQNEMSYTIIGWIHQIFQMLPIIVILFYSIRENVFKSNIEENKSLNKFLFFAYILIYLSFLFWGEASKHLRTRFWDASYLPLCYFLSQFLSTRRTKFIVRFVMLLLFISFSWRVFYNIYSF